MKKDCIIQNERMKKYSDLMQNAQQKNHSKSGGLHLPKFEKRVLYAYISVPVLTLVFVWGSLFFQFLQASLVVNSTDQQPTMGQSSFRYEGQQRESYINNKDYDQLGIDYDDQLIYLEEYNAKQDNPSIQYYTNEDGEQIFVGYKTGRVNPERIQARRELSNYGGGYRYAKTNVTRRTPANLENNRVRIYLQQRQQEQEEAEIAEMYSDNEPIEIVPPDMFFSAPKRIAEIKQQVIDQSPPPTVALSSERHGPDEYRIWIDFNESVQGFEKEDLDIRNGLVLFFRQETDTRYLADIQSINRFEMLRVSLPEGRVYNEHYKVNKTSNVLEIPGAEKPKIKIKML
jgi:hypothetical protein